MATGFGATHWQHRNGQFRSLPLKSRSAQKNFRQPLARTLEPGTLPEIFVDVGGSVA